MPELKTYRTDDKLFKIDSTLTDLLIADLRYFGRGRTCLFLGERMGRGNYSPYYSLGSLTEAKQSGAYVFFRGQDKDVIIFTHLPLLEEGKPIKGIIEGGEILATISPSSEGPHDIIRVNKVKHILFDPEEFYDYLAERGAQEVSYQPLMR